MAAPEIYGSGTTPVHSDTKRMLWAKVLKQQGGTPTRADTQRMLKARVAKANNGLTINNTQT